MRIEHNISISNTISHEVNGKGGGTVNASWGQITGTITNQTDLITELNKKADKTEIPSLTGYATESWVEGKGYLTEHQSLDEYAKKTEIPSLTGYATEQWVEDKGYLTEHQQLKTINDQSIIGEGNIEIQGGSDIPEPSTGVLAYMDNIICQDNEKLYFSNNDFYFTKSGASPNQTILPDANGDLKVYYIFNGNSLYKQSDDGKSVSYIGNVDVPVYSEISRKTYKIFDEYFICNWSQFYKWNSQTETFTSVFSDFSLMENKRIMNISDDLCYYLNGEWLYKVVKNTEGGNYFSIEMVGSIPYINDVFEFKGDFYSSNGDYYYKFNQTTKTFDNKSLSETPFICSYLHSFNFSGDYCYNSSYLYKYDCETAKFVTIQFTNNCFNNLCSDNTGKIYFSVLVGQNQISKYLKENDEIEWSNDYATKDDLSYKQDILVSGQNIKTINGSDITGYGNVNPYPYTDILNEGTVDYILSTASYDGMDTIEKTKIQFENWGAFIQYDGIKIWGDDTIGYHTYCNGINWLYDKNSKLFKQITFQLGDNSDSWPDWMGNVVKFNGEWIIVNTDCYYRNIRKISEGVYKADRYVINIDEGSEQGYISDLNYNIHVVYDDWMGVDVLVVYKGSEYYYCINAKTNLWYKNTWENGGVSGSSCLRNKPIYLTNNEKYQLIPSTGGVNLLGSLSNITDTASYYFEYSPNKFIVKNPSYWNHFRKMDYNEFEQMGDYTGSNSYEITNPYEISVNSMFKLYGSTYVNITNTVYKFKDTYCKWIEQSGVSMEQVESKINTKLTGYATESYVQQQINSSLGTINTITEQILS